MGDIRVLIVDDSPTVCTIFKNGLDRIDGIRVIGVAPDAYVARDMIVRDPPDVVTLDIEMPRMDGLTFLRKLMKHFPLPVVVVSGLTVEGSGKAIEALACGAVEVACKHWTQDPGHDLLRELAHKVRAASLASVGRAVAADSRTVAAGGRVSLPTVANAGDRILAIGSSTGGTEALARIFSRLPANTPGTLVVQHMPPGFTAQMASRLDGLSAMTVREARQGDELRPGLALVAPGDRHLLLSRQGAVFRAVLRDGPRVGRHKPAVDVLFRTVADVAGPAGVGVILTGMGKDGAQGLLAMRETGAGTIAQDEASCVVYGMPREAAEIGAAETVASLDNIPEHICRCLARKPVETGATSK